MTNKFSYCFVLSLCGYSMVAELLHKDIRYDGYEDIVSAHELDLQQYDLLDMIEMSISDKFKDKLTSVQKHALEFKQAMQEIKEEWSIAQNEGKESFLANPRINIEKLKETEKLDISGDAISKIVEFFLVDIQFWTKALRFDVALSKAVVTAQTGSDPKVAFSQLVEPSLDFAFDALRKFSASFAELFKAPDSVSKKLLQIVSNIFCKLESKKIAKKVNAFLFPGLQSKGGSGGGTDVVTRKQVDIKFDTVDKEIATVGKEIATEDLKIEELKLRLERMETHGTVAARVRRLGTKGMMTLIKSGAGKAKRALKLFIHIIVDLQWTLINKLVEKIINDVTVDGDKETAGIHGIVNAFADTWLEAIPAVLRNTVSKMGVDITKATADMLMGYVDSIVPWKSKMEDLKKMVQTWLTENMRTTCEATKISSAKSISNVDEESYKTAAQRYEGEFQNQVAVQPFVYVQYVAYNPARNASVMGLLLVVVVAC
eukprot:CAMPEP_0202687768 /NCGR_PEP_ID=MMETSP1385-20130828/3391_1 /ASSEMBLY_ACC=CAM_ASM_000861 /TAXON_ID=933848 /ORGANISM="Elphidium margaritaceum" /LENGTH=485 /DNA_ID=CAMNT_0049342611 /DNA_START=100 /DNA_END=1554 /DNA_ORIENTATION=-